MKKKITLYRNSKDVIGISNNDLDVILELIRTGNFELSDMINELRQLQGDAYKQYKRENLPMMTGSGTFSYRNGAPNNMLDYNNILILDFDFPENTPREYIENCKQQVIAYGTPLHLYAVWLSPGHGIKCALWHDNSDPAFHAQLFNRVQKELFYGHTDPCCSDVCRGCYLSYDPELWINRDPSLTPYHFVPDPNIPITTASHSNKPAKKDSFTGTFTHTDEEIEMNRKWQLIYADKTVMNMLVKSFNYRNPDYYKDGNRHSEVLRRATIYCKDGILYDNAVWSLTGQFGEASKAGLNNNDILSMVTSCYNKARADFGCERYAYLQRHYLEKSNRTPH